MIIKVKDLEFAYKNFCLRIPHLNFLEGKITCIVGPNGAGKTTLLKCLGGILPISKNTVYINGSDLSTLKGPVRARQICYVPQEQGSVFNYLVSDFVLMGRAAYISPFSSPSGKDRKISEKALEYVGISDYATRPIFELSSGERRLVLIARALAQEAEIMLLDEPTSFLDPRHESEILDFIARLASEKNMTILLTLHDLEMAVHSADNMVFIKSGQVVASGRPHEIVTEDLLGEVYEIPMRILQYEGKTLILR